MIDGDSARWRCSVCGEWYPVTVMARDCEAKHERAATQTGATT